MRHTRRAGRNGPASQSANSTQQHNGHEGAAGAPSRPTLEHLISFLYYHKTGHDLSRTLARVVSSMLTGDKGKFGFPYHYKRQRFSADHSCPEGGKVSVWPAPELFPLAPLPSCNIVVHMVRDPALWAISAYDYHRQDPTPEHWVKVYKPSCSFKHREGWTNSSTVLGLDAKTLTRLMKACNALVKPGKTYWEHLNILTEADGVRLTAFMNIFGGEATAAFGDLTRSAANGLSLRGTLNVNLWMDEVMSNLEPAMKSLANFLVSSLGRDNEYQEERRRLTRTLLEQLTSALVTAQEVNYGTKSRSSNKHVTSSTTDVKVKTRKARLAANLSSDALLGPVYRQWSRNFEANYGTSSRQLLPLLILQPTSMPQLQPTVAPTTSPQPSLQPTSVPQLQPTVAPTTPPQPSPAVVASLVEHATAAREPRSQPNIEPTQHQVAQKEGPKGSTANRGSLRNVSASSPVPAQQTICGSIHLMPPVSAASAALFLALVCIIRHVCAQQTGWRLGCLAQALVASAIISTSKPANPGVGTRPVPHSQRTK